ncbi:MAG: M48 family metalloprotease [Candidatus Nitrospinota bacterium M3_3B_026]
MTFRNTAASAALVLILAALSTGPAAAQPDEETIGRETDKEIVQQFGLYDDEELREYVRRVGEKVLTQIRDRQFDYHFRLLDHEMVNAFALPGGYVYVTRGLLAALNSEAELANVIGHEIGHVIGHHAIKQTRKQLGSLLLTLGGLAVSQDVRENAGAWLTVTSTLTDQILRGYGREMEMESDLVGMQNAYYAGYDPTGMTGFLSTLREMERLGGISYHGFYATHPDTRIRVGEAEKMSQILKGRGGNVNFFRDRYLDAIDGLKYGKPKWRGRTSPPHEVRIHTVKEGETFRSIAKDVSGDEGLALEIAVLNGMDHDTPLEPGLRIKTIAPVKTGVAQPGEKEDKKDEVGAGAGDGKGREDGGGGEAPDR